jgi:hypothetical protein
LKGEYFTLSDRFPFLCGAGWFRSVQAAPGAAFFDEMVLRRQALLGIPW